MIIMGEKGEKGMMVLLFIGISTSGFVLGCFIRDTVTACPEISYHTACQVWFSF